MAEKSNNENEESSAWKKLHSGSSTDIFQALVYFRTKFLKKPNGTREFLKKGGIRFIISIVEKPKFTDIALSILANCCLDEAVRQEVFRRDAVKSIVRIFKNLASTSIQNRACRALANIALSPKGVDLLFKYSAIPLVVKFLSTNTDSESQQTAIRALRLFTQKPEHHAELIKHEGILLISKCLSSDDNELLKCTVKAIASLTRHCSTECANQIEQAQGLAPLVKLASSPKSVISENALISLTNLSGQSTIRPALGNAGVIAVFIMHIDKPQSSVPGTAALIMALCLYCREVVNRVKIRDEKGLKTMLNIMDSEAYAALSKRIISSLLWFRYDESGLEELLELGMVPILVKHLNEYIDHNKTEHVEQLDDLDTKEGQSANQSEPSNVVYEDIDADKTNVQLEDDEDKDKTLSPLDASQENEDEEETENQSLSNVATKKFCIHSPSYKEVQNEKLELAGVPGDSASWDTPLWECSPRSYSSDRYSVDWSQASPLSDYTSQGSWSPVASPGSADLSPNWSPVLVANSPESNSRSFSPIQDLCSYSPSSSPMSALSPGTPFEDREACYSPVCDEQQSEAEEEVTKSALLQVVKPESELPLEEKDSKSDSSRLENHPKESRSNKDVAEKSSFPLHFRKRGQNASSNQVDAASTDSASLRKRCRRQDSTQSGSGSDTKQDPKPTIKKDTSDENHPEVHYILVTLSHLSHVERFSSNIATQACICALLDYVVYVPQPISRAERILIRLATNYNCFQELLELGFVEKVINILDEKHNLELCHKCQKFSTLKNRLLNAFGSVSESGYGVGVLSHKLLTGKLSEQITTVLSIPYLVRQHTLLQKLLFEYSGLDVLMKIIQDTSGALFPFSVKSLSKLCCNLGVVSDVVKEEVKDSVANDIPCKYFQVSLAPDVNFILDDLTHVQANRSILCSHSLYFDAMLRGSFSESMQTNVSLPEISKEVLLCVFHHVYKCTVVGCSTYGSAAIDTLLELIAACDKLLLPEFQAEAAKRLSRKLFATNVAEVYLHSKKYNCEFLASAALNYILAGSMVDENRQKWITALVQSPFWQFVVNDIYQVISCKLPEGKWHAKNSPVKKLTGEII